ncbi:hypothetical protein [Paenibacillus sp. 481]|uniref:hypothetical protein n=1 Tax=Paenibacillus sp. 481 TaxID=2835869 RepID=UPI001E35C8C3|nr:hypothetical protein [Paenibacillus sp. 481]UHA71923.1 hypothetical protein KIK04_14410 [Paenibacillus sp. 481]
MIDTISTQRFLYFSIRNKINILDFEQWLYNHDELEIIFGEQEYLEFISRDYASIYAFQETEKQIRKLVNFGMFEQERLISLLHELNQDQGITRFLEVIATLYDEYCEGYDFLRFIALTFITTSEEYQEVLRQGNQSFDFKSPVIQEAIRLLTFFEKKELLIIAEHEYIDNRAEQDKIEMHSINEMFKS